MVSERHARSWRRSSGALTPRPGRSCQSIFTANAPIWDPILEIARRRSLLVVEGYCPGPWRDLQRTQRGHHGRYLVSSFYPGKNAGAYGEGAGWGRDAKRRVDEEVCASATGAGTGSTPRSPGLQLSDGRCSGRGVGVKMDHRGSGPEGLPGGGLASPAAADGRASNCPKKSGTAPRLACLWRQVSPDHRERIMAGLRGTQDRRQPALRSPSICSPVLRNSV